MRWSWLRGYRFEALALVAIVAAFAISEAGAVSHFVADLFGPINRTIEALRT